MAKLRTEFIKLNSNVRLHHCPNPIIGLTGGIASGKSSVAKLFSQKDVTVIDADQLIKEIYQYPQIREKIKQQFPDVFDTFGEIDFQLLRKKAFAIPEQLKILEAILYQELPQAFIQKIKKITDQTPVIYDVPLLFEKGIDKLVDLTICVYCSREIQIKRLMARDKSSMELVQQILDQQMDIETKAKMADFVLQNNDDINTLEKNFEQLFKKIFIG